MIAKDTVINVLKKVAAFFNLKKPDSHKPGYFKDKPDRHGKGYYRKYNRAHPERLNKGFTKRYKNGNVSNRLDIKKDEKIWLGPDTYIVGYDKMGRPITNHPLSDL